MGWGFPQDRQRRRQNSKRTFPVATRSKEPFARPFLTLGVFAVKNPLSIAALMLIAVMAYPAHAGSGENSLIKWRGWSDDLFEVAAREGRFVLLDLEAVWCHWCHVMDDETYSKQPIADLINEKYIAVRVDQDANPDLSNRYGNWGWPATIVFAPDGTEIVKRRGFIPAPMMLSLLQAIIDDPSPGPSVVAQAEIEPADVGQLTGAQRQQLLNDYWKVYDADHGGWGNVHKFIDGPTLEYALARAAQGERLHELMARQTLTQATHLLDPAWGGVYQYSDHVDWRSPHYEKIMLSQASALRAYAFAHALWGGRNASFLEAAGNVQKYLLTRMRSADGAFYTSQDADVDAAMDGAAFYALDAKARAALGKAPVIDRNHYARENGWVIDALGALYDVTGEREVLTAAARAARWILSHRALEGGGFSHGNNDRGGPFLGDSAAMAAAFVRLYGSTGNREWLGHAEAALQFIEQHFRSARAGYVSHPVQPGAIGVFAKEVVLLEENVDLARSALRVHWYSGDERYRRMAAQAMRFLGSPTITDNRLFLHGVLLVDAEFTAEPVHITIVGHKDDARAQALHAAALRFAAGFKRVEWWDKREGPMPNPDVQYPGLNRAAAFACSNRTCSLPVFAPEDVAAAVRRLMTPESG